MASGPARKAARFGASIEAQLRGAVILLGGFPLMLDDPCYASIVS